MRWLCIFLLQCALLSTAVAAPPTECEICDASLRDGAWTVVDQVEQDKTWLCGSCADLTTVCYVCGVPCIKDYLTLSDNRIVCSRDRVGAVIDEEVALRICEDVHRVLEASLGRFAEFPATNVRVRLADRIDVRALVGVAGYDHACPNLLGYTLSLQKPGYLDHDIRLLTGLQKGVLQSTYAHELAHAWIAENVSASRRLSVHPDAIEGFCELIGYVVAESYRDPAAISHILENEYTRGQILLFIEARRRFGVGDIFDWIQYGETRYLTDRQLSALREVQMPAQQPSRPVSEILYIPATPPPPRDSLELTSITTGPRVSIVTINGRAFEEGEQRRVKVGGTNLLLRCVAVKDKVVIVEHVESGKRQELRLAPRQTTPTEEPEAVVEDP